MAEIRIIVAGVSKIGKSKLIDKIVQNFGVNVQKNLYHTQMILKGTNVKIILQEYTIYQPYLEGPCKLLEDDPFVTCKPDIFYFLYNNLDLNSICNLSTWLVFLKEKNKKIKIFDMGNKEEGELNDSMTFPVIHPRLEEFIGQKIDLMTINIQEIKNDILEFIDAQLTEKTPVVLIDKIPKEISEIEDLKVSVLKNQV